MKKQITPKWLPRLAGIIIIELIIWGIITDNSSIVFLGLVNVLLVGLFFRDLFCNLLGIDNNKKKAIKKTLIKGINNYGNAIVSCIFIRFFLQWLITGYGQGNTFCVFLILIILSKATNWNLFKKGLYRGDKPVPLYAIVFIASLFVIGLLLSRNWMMPHALLYPFVVGAGFLFFTLGSEIDRTSSGIMWWRQPLRIIYGLFFGFAIVWGAGTFFLDRIDDHTIEKIIYEEKPVYIYDDGDDTNTDSDDDASTAKDLLEDQGDQAFLDPKLDDEALSDEPLVDEIQDLEDTDDQYVSEQPSSILSTPTPTTLTPTGQTTYRVLSPSRTLSVSSVVEETNTNTVGDSLGLEGEVDDLVLQDDAVSINIGSYLKMREIIGSTDEPKEQNDDGVSLFEPVVVIPTTSEQDGVDALPILSPLEETIKKNNPSSVQELFAN